jgi:hypothetical protein
MKRQVLAASLGNHLVKDSFVIRGSPRRQGRGVNSSISEGFEQAWLLVRVVPTATA